MSSLESLLASATSTGNYTLLRVLGAGGEGTVYLIRDDVTRTRLVVKRFHEPRRCDGAVGLAAYASGVTPNALGLPCVHLLVNANHIEGLYYSWTPLFAMHPRVLAASDRLRQSIIGAFCRMQHHLMSQLGIGLWDVNADHFLLDRRGVWHYVDFGWGVTLVGRPRVVDQGYYGYAFAMLLLSLYGINIKLIHLPSPGYQYDRPSAYWQLGCFDKLSKEHTWVLGLVSKARHCPASIFREPEFYQEVGDILPHRAALPLVATSASLLLRQAGKLRKIGRVA